MALHMAFDSAASCSFKRPFAVTCCLPLGGSSAGKWHILPPEVARSESSREGISKGCACWTMAMTMGGVGRGGACYGVAVAWGGARAGHGA